MNKIKLISLGLLFFTLSIPKVLSQPLATDDTSADQPLASEFQIIKPEQQDREVKTISEEGPGVDVAASKQPAPAKGMYVQIPKIGVNAPVITVGLKKNRELDVPANGKLAGWYKYSPKPGNIGTSVLDGHMDYGTNFIPGVFYNLYKLDIGDEISVGRGDGTTAVFFVKLMEVYSQDNFPTKKVYTPAKQAELRVITCAGSYNPAKNRYTHNLVVYAELKEIIPST